MISSTRSIEIYADGADLRAMERLAPKVAGFTTNPSLLKKAGILDYRSFAREVLAISGGKPVSFEVLADDLQTMERQAREIATWGPNVMVKIPVTNSLGTSTQPVIYDLTADDIRVNVTAIFTIGQARHVLAAIAKPGSIISIFAGRIADTGRDPHAIVWSAVSASHTKTRVLWASSRQIFSLIEAQRAGAQIITMTPDLIEKAEQYFGRDLELFSRETVLQFKKDSEGITL